MQSRWIIPVVAILAVGVLVTPALAGEEHETEVTLEQLPPAVKATLERAAHGATAKEIEKEVEDGKTVYEADIIVDGKKTEIKIGEDGTLISSKVDKDDDDDEKEGDKED